MIRKDMRVLPRLETENATRSCIQQPPTLEQSAAVVIHTQINLNVQVSSHSRQLCDEEWLGPSFLSFFESQKIRENQSHLN